MIIVLLRLMHCKGNSTAMGSSGQIEIRPVVENDLEELAEKHPKFMPGYYTSLLGQFYLRTFFWPAIFNDQSTRSFVAQNRNGIVGFIICTTNSQNLKRSIMSRMLYLGNVIIISKCLFSRIIFASTLENFRSLFRKRPDELPSSELFLIGVDLDSRGSGIGRQLMMKMGEFFRSEKIDQVFLRVKESNLTAISLYKKMGYQVHSHTHEMGEDWVIMTTST